MKSWKRVIATFTILVLCLPLIGTTGAQAASVHNRVVELRDNCEPTSFNAEFGPGFCTKADGTVTLAKFRAALKDGGSGAWWIRQRDITLDQGDTIAASNVGGILHTYTEVAQFGKGCIAEWNTAVKETVDNCDFGRFGATLVLPGGTSTPQVLAKGVHKFQCLVHPWMREVVTVRT